MNNSYNLALAFLDRFPMMCFVTMLSPCSLVSVEVLHKVTKTIRTFSTDHIVHSHECLWGGDTHTF